MTRVPFVTDLQGGAGAMFREQIGCSLFDCVSLSARLDMWVDDEAIMNVDVRDSTALREHLNVVATLLTNVFGVARPVFGAVVITALAGESAAPLDGDQLALLERLSGLCNEVRARRMVRS
ncbi:hypothetical protein [Mycobacterium sp.]|uniref:hypothetical protein n=1 Tax=Mycobacterium sp. TaxID=1785 RepID=UPI0025E9AB03|nr:hypothetical protein [Mycobacterium sp.]